MFLQSIPQFQWECADEQPDWVGYQGADGAPKGFVRQDGLDDNGEHVYAISEFVNGKRHGHVVLYYGECDNEVGSGDYLRGKKYDQ